MQDRYDQIWRELEAPSKFAWAIALSFMLHLVVGAFAWRLLFVQPDELPPVQTITFMAEGPQSDEPLATTPEPAPPEPEPEPEPEPVKPPPPEPMPEPEPIPEPKPEPPKEEPKTVLPEPVVEPEPEPEKPEPEPMPEPDPPEPEPEPAPDPPEPDPEPEPAAPDPEPEPMPKEPEPTPPARVEGPAEPRVSIKLPSVIGFWGSMVKRKVEQRWAVPPGVPIGDTVTVMFTVDRSGRLLLGPEVVGTASDQLRASAVQAVVSAAPYPPLPDDYRELEQQVVMTFRAE